MTWIARGGSFVCLRFICTDALFRRADSSNEQPAANGLTEFGEKVVREMNRLGMLVDLSHVSENTTRAAIRVSRAPVVFSHSSVYSLCNHKRNVPDDIIQSLKENGGIIMVNFFPDFVKCAPNATISDVAGEYNGRIVQLQRTCVEFWTPTPPPGPPAPAANWQTCQTRRVCQTDTKCTPEFILTYFIGL
ncbi:hypothetical protein O3G_MSEX004687 [Manduca sexta]|uniref:Dipeptidase n=1 Tax=Manduca sexta TaxID=7130 RepID=A0A921YW84_MANSE|nr:hypothetical protein O3G_MSEX004687 [Manduca sexta]